MPTTTLTDICRALEKGDGELFIDHLRRRASLKTLHRHRRLSYEEATAALALELPPERILQIFSPADDPYEPSPDETAAFIEITPDVARAMLACNRDNRPLSRGQVGR